MKRPLGLSLIYAGAAACAVGAAGLAFGAFVHIPEWVAWKMMRAVAYTAPFMVGASLMVAGALVGRAARRKDEGETRGAAPPPPAETRPLPPGPAAEVPVAPREGSERRR